MRKVTGGRASQAKLKDNRGTGSHYFKHINFMSKDQKIPVINGFCVNCGKCFNDMLELGLLSHYVQYSHTNRKYQLHKLPPLLCHLSVPCAFYSTIQDLKASLCSPRRVMMIVQAGLLYIIKISVRIPMMTNNFILLQVLSVGNSRVREPRVEFAMLAGHLLSAIRLLATERHIVSFLLDELRKKIHEGTARLHIFQRFYRHLDEVLSKLMSGEDFAGYLYAQFLTDWLGNGDWGVIDTGRLMNNILEMPPMGQAYPFSQEDNSYFIESFQSRRSTLDRPINIEFEQVQLISAVNSFIRPFISQFQ